MKTKIFFVMLLFSTSFINAQIYTQNAAIAGPSTTNNVGIGTSTPAEKLTISGDHGNTRFLLHSSGSGYPADEADLLLWASEPGLTYSGVGISNNIHNFTTSSGLLKLLNPLKGGSYIRLLDNAMMLNVVSSSGVDRQALNIDGNGNVNIGNISANTKLDVFGYINSYNSSFGQIDVSTSTKNYVNFGSNTHGSLLISSNLYFNNGSLKVANTHPSMSGGAIMIPGNSQPNQGKILFYTNESGPVVKDQDYSGTISMAIAGNGSVGINTINPDEKLTVNGKIHAQEVRIDLTAPMTVPDYVFASDYKLKSLEEVEKYIKQNNHLPEIPSAQEIETNGLMLAEMNMSLLKKIEEMTLYMIEMKKEIEALKNKNN